MATKIQGRFLYVYKFCILINCQSSLLPIVENKYFFIHANLGYQILSPVMYCNDYIKTTEQ